MFAFFSLLTVVVLTLWFVNFFPVYFKGMDCFHYVTYGIFALWFNLNQVFVIKFSVSFVTVVKLTRKNQPIAWFHRDLRLTKNLKRATGHLSFQRTTHVAWNPCCLIWWKTCIFVHLMLNKCICHDLHVVVTVLVLVLFFFYFSFVCRNSTFQVNRTNDASGRTTPYLERPSRRFYQYLKRRTTQV